MVDHPEVLEIAKEIESSYSIDYEVDYVPLDFMMEEIPGSYDMILVSNMLHMLGENESKTLIKRLYKSINAGGSIVIQARFLEDDRLGSYPEIFLDLLQLCITPNGRNHSVCETKVWLENAGFGDIEFNTMSVINANSYLRGYKALSPE